MNKRLIILAISGVISTNSCHIVKPFFIKNKKKEARQEKRVEKKIEKGKMDSALVKKELPHIIPKFDTILARKIINYRNINYKTFQSKTKMHYEAGEQKQNFTANFRLEKNTKIWASISGFGIEVARAIITPDSVKAIDRFNKRYYLYSYRDLQKLINMEVDFKILQDIIVGNSIATEGKINDIKELNALMSIFISSEDYSNQLTYNKTDSTLKQIQLQTTRSVSKSAVLVSLNNYQLLENKFISTDRTYYIQDVKGAAQLNMEVNKIDIDKVIEFPFSIPSNFKKAMK
jgi:hypothetical protein